MGFIDWAKDKWNKTKEFCAEHKETLIRTGIAVASAAAGIGGAVLYNRRCTQKEMTKLEHIFNDNTNIEPLESNYDEIMTRGWKEEDYRESWNKVEELMKNLDLKPGEEFIITGPDTYTEQPNPILSHLIYGDGCYPPDPTGD